MTGMADNRDSTGSTAPGMPEGHGRDCRRIELPSGPAHLAPGRAYRFTIEGVLLDEPGRHICAGANLAIGYGHRYGRHYLHPSGIAAVEPLGPSWWPPQPGDLLADGNGSLFFAQASTGGGPSVLMVSQDPGNEVSTGALPRGHFAHWRLLYRCSLYRDGQPS